MAKRVVLKGEARPVGTKLIQIDEECTLPDHLAMVLENKGLCVIIAHGEAVEMIETKMPMVPVETKVAKAAKAKAAKAKAVKAAKAKAAAKTKGGKPVTIDDLAGGRHTANRSKSK